MTGSKGCSADGGVTGLKCEDPNAECLKGVCKCKSGTKQIDWICEGSMWDQPCNMTSSYNCGAHGRLSCKNAKCQCPDESMVFNQATLTCEIPVGERCERGNYWRYPCAEGSTCTEDKSGEGIDVCQVATV